MARRQYKDSGLPGTPEIVTSFLSYVFSGLLWVAGGLLYLTTIPEEWWRFRDDSVIHLSQARNFSIYGSVGLSAGDRVEAMSSPLNFGISWLAYGINPDISYQRYLHVYLVLTLLLLSLSINFLLRMTLGKRLTSTNTNLLVTNIVVFLVTISSWTTFGWLISGMENILCAAIFGFLLGNLLKESNRIAWILFLFTLLGICRIEMAALIAPILLLASQRTQISLKKSRFLYLIPFLIWALIHVGRYVYFGHFLPNTATALDKHLPLQLIIFMGVQYLILLSTILGKKKSLNLIRNPFIILGLLLLIILGVSRISTSGYPPVYSIALVLSFLGLLLTLIGFVITPTSFWKLEILILVAMIPLNHFFLFGPARLSAFRIVSMFAVPIILLVAILLHGRIQKVLKGKYGLVVGFGFLIVLGAFALEVDKPRNLCCSISPSEKIISLQAEKAFGSLYTQGERPIVANPDLGKVSFTKDFMNVDLGLIGEPLLAKIAINYPHLVDEYLVHLVAPDVVELHGHWSCTYSEFLDHPKFRTEWKLSWSGYVSKEMSPGNNETCPRGGKYSIWTRSLPIEEQILTKKIASEKFSHYSALILDHLQTCTSELGRCEFVTRSIIRNKSNLLESGDLEKTVGLLNGKKFFEVDSLRILQPPNWDSQAFVLIHDQLKALSKEG